MRRTSSSRLRPAARARVVVAFLGALCAAGLVACSGSTDPGPDDRVTPTAPSPGGETETETNTLPAQIPDIPVMDVAGVTPITTGLAAPWGLARLPDGDFLVTLRDRGQLVRIAQDTGRQTTIGGPGAQELAMSTVTAGEGGLLGLALSPSYVEDHRVFLYRTTESGNQVLSAEFKGDTLSNPTVLLDGIPAATTHNGGALAVGPDTMLYAGTGDAGEPDSAQDIDSLAGKTLRIALDGSIPDDNPLPGSPVWTSGHRNVQGFAWDNQERMYASEFGANKVDELNIIRTGGNYGWPEHEGPGGADDGFTDPILTWPTAEASPSGIAVTADAVYLAALRGARLWRVPLAQLFTESQIRPQPLLNNEYGRLRNVIALAGGDLAVLTNNTDGRGEPGRKDDRLLRVDLVAAPSPQGRESEEPAPGGEPTD